MSISHNLIILIPTTGYRHLEIYVENHGSKGQSLANGVREAPLASDREPSFPSSVRYERLESVYLKKGESGIGFQRSPPFEPDVGYGQQRTKAMPT